MPVLHDERVLAFNADCIAFCPIEGHHDLLAAGTYQLNESTATRTGRLYLYSLRSDEGRNRVLHELSTLDLPGIFDLKWEPNPTATAPWLALALTDGTVALVELGEDKEAVRKGSVDIGKAALTTCVAFEPPAAAPHKVLGASTSNGFLATIAVDGSHATVLKKWLAHDLEIWACAFDCWQENLLYSGADDAILKAWDIRAPTGAPVFQNRKEHGAGVCCIQPSEQNEHVLCTGSYDEHIRLWDTRNPCRPVITAKAGTGGGVWRVNWHPLDGSLLLAACMHNGCAVFRADAAAGSLEAVARYEGHGSIAYGADWFTGIDAGDQPVIASCSFYDNLLQVWSCRLPECSANSNSGIEAVA